MSAPLLQTRELVVARGTRTVLHGVSCELREGELTALIGPNGSGKSTLIHALFGALPARSGELRLTGRPLAEVTLAERARLMALVPQTPEAPPGLTVRELVGLGRLPWQRGFSANSAEDEAAVDRALADADVTALADVELTRLSGGEQARAHLGRALAQEPRALVLDEPTAHLDLAHRAGLLRLARRLVTRGRSVLVAVHDLELAAAHCDRFIVLHEGRVAADGAAAEALAPDILSRVFGVRGSLRLRDGKPVGLELDWHHEDEGTPP